AANVKQFMNAVAKGDAAAVADIYASDAVILVPNHEMVKGREAIEKFWAEYLHSGIKSVELKTLEAASSGNMGYELGTYSEIGEGGKVLDQGKYIVLIKRDGNRWKYFRDCWNSNSPPGK